MRTVVGFTCNCLLLKVSQLNFSLRHVRDYTRIEQLMERRVLQS
jgi:hypothetical protein